jgi:hypothetical protein
VVDLVCDKVWPRLVGLFPVNGRQHVAPTAGRVVNHACDGTSQGYDEFSERRRRDELSACLALPFGCLSQESLANFDRAVLMNHPGKFRDQCGGVGHFGRYEPKRTPLEMFAHDVCGQSHQLERIDGELVPPQPAVRVNPALQHVHTQHP